jgi:hypothetical protein
MPKIYDTRKHKAAELLRLAAKGPCSLSEDDKAAYSRWANTWVIPLLLELVPELRKKKTD